ncbi:tetratricopeptide (TPR) repeat protein [Desulfobaculum xiamenense]|uniref:Tetratricopeptide (TPR) repeat protein n=1 Tax=Desulfobaculum xiamenense TaxID=995050 RepID=A0A846QJ35_9BACT|nr:tetratricopeptide repeat protein [Desulfobaculum xiamenense]NJB67067.1 tetratricopeptide (TPR) repeat protein [Desulfobaculum xiamenense]
MSTELIKARTQLAGISRYLKQDKLLPAIVSLHDALNIILRTPLMGHEKKEFATSVEQALYVLNHDAEFKKVCPIILEYHEGGERQLLSSLKELLEDLQGTAVDEAKQLLAAIEEQKVIGLKRGEELLARKKFKDAKFVFNKLVLQFADDTDLKTQIAEMLLKAERHEDALEFLTQALKEFPESAHLYNRVGMVLRKMTRFEMSEKYYAKALKLAKEDPGLYFNIGRLYIDWKKWDKVARVAAMAVKLSPDFTEARKMLTFAKKKMSAAASKSE